MVNCGNEETDLGKKSKTSSKDGSPDELKEDGDLVGEGVVSVLSRVYDDGGDEKTNRDHPLVTGDNSSTNSLGRDLGLVHGNETEESKKTSASIKSRTPNKLTTTFLLHPIPQTHDR